MASEPARRRFTVEEYDRMGEVGLLAEDERVELLEGEVIAMTPIGSPHAGTVKRLTELLVIALTGRAIVGVQDPVWLSDLSEPKPDVAVLRPREDFYTSGHPRPADVLLLIEVADTTAAFDRNVKRPLYAAAGIPEVWVVDLAAKVVDVALDPAPDGYRDVRPVRRDGVISPGAFPDVRISVAELLP
jgi:Uma2 family endonuclease